MASSDIFKLQQQPDVDVNSKAADQQHQRQHQPHKRTRSQLQLPVFNVEFARSPLKEARDAMRRAKLHTNKSPLTLSDSQDEDDMGSEKNNVDEKEDGHAPPDDQQRSKEASHCTDAQPSIGDEILLSPRKQNSNNYNANPIPQSISDPNSKAAAKRSRSPTFEDVFGGLGKNGANATCSVANDNESKRPKLRSTSAGTRQGARGPLDAFFTHQPSKLSKSVFEQDDQLSLSSSMDPRDVFSEINASSSSRMADQPVVPATPTMKQLRAMPSLDLRTMTPSPRKPAPNIGIGLGTPSGSKLRAISEWNSARMRRMDDGGTDGGLPGLEEEDTRPQAQDPPPNTSPSRTLLAPSTPSHAMDVDQSSPHKPSLNPSAPSLLQGNPEDRMNVDSFVQNVQRNIFEPTIPPTISIMSDISTDSNSGTRTSQEQKREYESTACATQNLVVSKAPVPATPRDQILPSRSRIDLPGNGKSFLSTFSSMSPLTPLPRAFSAANDDDDYDYHEEEEAIEAFEESSGVPQKQMQMQKGSPTVFTLVARSPSTVTGTEQDPRLASVLSATSSTASSTGSSHPASMKPPNSKSNASKTKTGSSLSKTETVAAMKEGLPKRLGRLVTLPSSTSTPRMRLTRAAVLRQKQHQRVLTGASPTRSKASSNPTLKQASATAASLRTAADEVDKENTVKSAGKGMQDEKSKGKPPKSKCATMCPPKSPTRKGPGDAGKGSEKQFQTRKSFVLTIPSSLSPLKNPGVSSSSSTDTSSSLPSSKSKSKLESRPFTFSLYPPPITDPAAKARAQSSLSNLSSALDKLTMPPPAKPSSAAEISKEGSERPRPSTSLGFSREMYAPVFSRQGQESAPRPLSRAGLIGPAKRCSSFLPTPKPPLFNAGAKDKGKASAKPGGLSSMHFSLGNAGTVAGIGARLPSGFRVSGANMGVGMGRVVFSRPIPRMRASQKTSLETVEGSPVKGAMPASRQTDDDGDVSMASHRSAVIQSTPSYDREGDASMITDSERVLPVKADNSDDLYANGKELKKISKLNASRRASMAFSALSQSLTTPTSGSEDKSRSGAASSGTVDSTAPHTDSSPAGKQQRQRAVSTSFSSSRPVRAAAVRSFVGRSMMTPAGLARSQSESTAPLAGASTAPASFGESDGENGSGFRFSKKGAMGRMKMAGSLDILNQCTIFVDVRTEEGEDAGGLFVDMLRGMGAKVLTRVGQTCTHIVYKNGLASTLTRFRLLDEPRPNVVGIGWVVECVEKRERVEETRFQVDLDSVSIGRTLKRRRSILPKQLSMSGPIDAFLNGKNPPGPPKVGIDSDSMSEDGELNNDCDNASGSNLKSSINYNPLEQARRRSVMAHRPLKG